MNHVKGFLHLGLPFLICLLVLSLARDVPESLKHTGTENAIYYAQLPKGPNRPVATPWGPNGPGHGSGNPTAPGGPHNK